MAKMTSSLAWDVTDSSFSMRLGTNYAPSSDELLELNRILVKPQQELDRLNSEIARVQAIFDTLHSQKRRVKSYINAHRALMAPIRQIPSETLAEIFYWCLPLDSDVRSGAHGVARAPLLLTTICWDWRRIALDTPRLWSSLHSQFLPDLPESQSRRVAEDDVQSRRIAGMETWLRRSGRLPITISLYSSRFSSYSFGGVSSFKTMAQLMKSLLGFGERVQNLSLFVNGGELKAFDQEILPSGLSFSSLLSFRLEDAFAAFGGGMENVIRSDNISPLLSRMPVLRNLEIPQQTWKGNLPFHLLQCHWGILTKLSLLPFLLPAELFSILTKSRALKELSVGILLETGLFDASALLPTTLLDLNSLKLIIQVNDPPPFFDFGLSREDQDREDKRRRTHHIACLSAITSRIICPALISLHVSLPNFHESISRLPILDFPLHALVTLRLEIPMTPEAFTECLSLVPNLISLDFVDAGNTLGDPLFGRRSTSTLQDTHLARLTPSTDNPFPFCQRLRDLRVKDRSTGSSYSPRRDWSTHALVELITARANTSKLDCFDFSVTDALSDEEIQTLRAVDEGERSRLRLHESYVPSPPSHSAFGQPGGGSQTGGRSFRYVRWSG
ncbi:hypothetical protein D9757_007494 [Collybiopsis confluens]|uniref:F-box domain-containing protein n=1 Tax=Collybiopsis confluens TaxID=2823264 RepID=A0A8H5HJE5_9AGAR|nr:hypothetical protein D9757_007494 [Collybiopsis confluens]